MLMSALASQCSTLHCTPIYNLHCTSVITPLIHQTFPTPMTAFYAALCCTALDFTALDFTALDFTALGFTALGFTALDFTALGFAALCFTALGTALLL